MRAPRVAATLLAAALLASACSNGGGGGGDRPRPSGTSALRKVTIGYYDLGESRLLAAMYAEVLGRAGYKTSLQKVSNHQVALQLLASGAVDVVPDYAGTLTEYLNRLVNGAKAKPVASGSLPVTMKALQGLAAKRKLRVLSPAAAANQTAFAVTKKFAAKYGVHRVSQLRRYPRPVVLGGPAQCPTSPSCLVGLRRVYGLKPQFKSLDAGGPQTKRALQAGTVQVGLVFSSDGGIDVYDLEVLADDKHLETVDNVVPVARAAAAEPAVVTALDKVSAVLTTTDLQGLNRRVDYDGDDPEHVAKDYLKAHDLG